MESIRLDKKKNVVNFVVSPLPKIENDDELIIKVAMCGICGTDLHILHGKYDSNDGVIMGHEMTGTVHEVPKGCKNFKIGDRVAVNPNFTCGTCFYCKKSLHNLCVKTGPSFALGIGVDGGWAQYCKAHMSLVYIIPDSLPFEHAVLSEPLSCIMQAFEKLLPIDIGSNILVIGAGIIGLLYCSVLHVMGHRSVYVSEPNPGRRNTLTNMDLGYKCGEWKDILRFREEDPDLRFDLCIDCSGNTEAIQGAISLLECGGRLMIFGVADPAKVFQVSAFEFYKKQLTLMGSVVNTISSFQKAINLMETLSNRYISLEKMGIKVFKLSEYKEALDTCAKGTYSKVVFEG